MFIVRFTRHAVEDLDVARENFSHLEFNPTLQLLEQFKFELYENTRLRGLWEILSHHDNYDDQQASNASQHYSGALFVWVQFNWPGTIIDFVKEVQRTFDECGMNGNFNIVDGVARDGTLYSRDDVVAAAAQLESVLPNPGSRAHIIPIGEDGTVKLCRRDDRQETIIEVVRDSDGKVHLCRECEIKKLD